MKYLSHPSTECILDNHRALRYNFCDIVGNVAKDLHRGAPELFEIVILICRPLNLY